MKPEQELWGFPVSSPTPYVRSTKYSSLGIGCFVVNLSGNGTDFRAFVAKEVFKAGPVYVPSPKAGRSGAWEV